MTNNTRKVGFFVRMKKMWRYHQLLSLFERCRRKARPDWIVDARSGMSRQQLLVQLTDTKFLIPWRQRFRFKFFYPNRRTASDEVTRQSNIQQCIDHCLSSEYGYLEPVPDDLKPNYAVVQGRSVEDVRITAKGMKMTGKSGYLSLSTEGNVGFWQVVLATGVGGIIGGATLLFGQIIWDWTIRMLK